MPPPKASSTGSTRSTKPKRSLSPMRHTPNGVVPKSILKKVSATGKLTHNRRLTFHNKKKTKRIPNINSMPQDILSDIWWAADDYDDIMESFEYTVFMMEAGEGKTVDDNEEHCTRGLELRTEAGKWARFEHKRDCYNAVLDEQDRQWNAGQDNQEKIANCCREVTAKTQRIACRKGMQDEREIADFVADTRALISGKGGIKNATNTNGKSMPSRTKSNSTGSGRRRTPRTDSGKARTVEKSPPRKPERVLSGKSERGEVTPTNSASGAPRTPKRSISSKSSESSKNSSVTPTNSSRLVQRMPQRQTFSNSSASPTRKTPSRTNSASSKSSKNKSGASPKIPKRSTSNNSMTSSHADSVQSTDSGGSVMTDGKGKLNKGALATFGG